MELWPLLPLLLSPSVAAAADLAQLLGGLELLGSLFGSAQPSPGLSLQNSAGQGVAGLFGGAAGQPNPLLALFGNRQPPPPPPPPPPSSPPLAQGLSSLFGNADLQAGFANFLGGGNSAPSPLQSGFSDLLGALSNSPTPPPPRFGQLRQRPSRPGGGLLESLKIVQPARVVQVQSAPSGGAGGGSLLDLLNPTRQGELQSQLIDQLTPAGLSVPKLTDIDFFDSNFGIKKKKGCIPFFSEVVRVLWADCRSKADSLTWNTWGRQIQNALKGGSLDLVAAAKETCRLQADRRSCQEMSERVQSCDILGSLQTTIDIQNAKKRCEDISTYTSLPQGPNAGTQLLTNVVQSVGTELAGGFIRNLLG